VKNWKSVLWVVWSANLFTSTGITMILPFLPMFIEEMGVSDPGEIVLWAGAVFSVQSVTSVLFQPLWGAWADRRGYKGALLFSGVGIASMTFLMGFAAAPWQLLTLRFINGMFAGFNALTRSFIASITPVEHAGKALGTLHTGMTAGMLLGPLLGGVLAGMFGIRTVFFITGGLILLSVLVVGVFVKEAKRERGQEQGQEKAEDKGKWSDLRPLLPVFAAISMTQVAMMSLQPIVPVFAGMLYSGEHMELITGLVISISGVGTLIGSPILGWISDRFGPRWVLILSMLACAVSFIPQALAQSIAMLLAARFALGLFMGGMLPTLNVFIRKMAPRHMHARAFGLSTSSQFSGNLIGPMLGSVVASAFGIRYVFWVTMILLLINIAFIYGNRKIREYGGASAAES
jgi:DHA1 family multidrug resistance protein-like MFS transporter